MTNNLSTYVFEDKNVRVIPYKDFVIFCLADCLEAINSSTTVTAAVNSIKSGLGKEFVINQPLPTLGGEQNLAFVTEAGLTFIVSRSRTQLGKKFNRWLHTRVLPEIRRTGNYIGNKQATEIVPLDPVDGAILALQKYKELKEEQQQLKIEQERLQQSQIDIIVQQEIQKQITLQAQQQSTEAIAKSLEAQEQSQQALTIASTLQTQIDQLQEFILSSPPPLSQSIRNKLVEAMQTLGGILSANNVYEGFECYERPWRELGLAMRNSGYRYDLNARYEREKRAYQQKLEDWIAQGRPRGFKPKKYTRPDILERDNRLKEAYEGARLLARRYLSNIAVS